MGVALVLSTAGAQAALGVEREPVAASAPGAGASSVTISLKWRPVPKVTGRIRADQIGVVINTADPYSVVVGEYYAKQRGIDPARILRLELPVQQRLSEAEFLQLRDKVEARFGAEVQALALAWVRPFAVECQSITAALSIGLDPEICRNTCGAPKRASPYFNSPSAQPWRDLGVRPSMLLAAGSVSHARGLIDRGLKSDYSLLLGSGTSRAHYQVTQDAARSVRLPLFPPPGRVPGRNVEVRVGEGVLPVDASSTLLVQTGLAQLPALDGVDWVPGALADHLTSFGGVLDGTAGQTPATAWIDAGATASYGTVSEPCNHLQKFPHPQLVLLHYLQGSTAVEAYWKSVAWPWQGVFVGDPLAAPFASISWR